MVAMEVLCGIRIRYIRVLIDSDLAGGVEEVRDSSGRLSYEDVDLVESTRVTCLVSENLNQFKGLMETTSTLGNGPLVHVHEDFSSVISNVIPTLVVGGGSNVSLACFGGSSGC
jgi:hypothetical protein